MAFVVPIEKLLVKNYSAARVLRPWLAIVRVTLSTSGMRRMTFTTRARCSRLRTRSSNTSEELSASFSSTATRSMLVSPEEMAAATAASTPILLATSTRISELNSLSVVADRKSTRLNSSHVAISYAVFCLKKKKKTFNHFFTTKKKKKKQKTH